MDLVTLIMRSSFGLIRTREQAQATLLVVFVVLIVATIIILMSDTTLPNTSPHVPANRMK